ncbi:MAG: peptidylprolyl isomerase [Gammaproteobacteria bacterium]|nr:peptidylprolyl isomerase [Gammaproteobacteria bacterium]MCP5415508.1 peptidylprolyl isomerase [Chromatiaceae bacterium]
MKFIQPGHRSLQVVLALFALYFTGAQAAGSDQPLVSVGTQMITAADLEKVLRSAPFATNFNTLDEKEQAFLRGGTLQRLVAAQLLFLEAKAQQLDRTESFRDELEKFRLGLLHRRFMEQLREGIQLPEQMRAQMKQEFTGNHDAIKAAESAFIADKYRQARIEAIRDLRQRYHVRVYAERFDPGATAETLLLEGDGIRVTYADLLHLPEKEKTREWIEHQVYARGELLLTSKAALDQGIDLSRELDSFSAERLPAALIEKLQAQWIPNDEPLEAYFQRHPEIGELLSRRHIGQLILSSRDEAEQMRQRILSGESLFNLAGQYSVDPYGRQHRGDMGWIKEDRGDPRINAAIANLEDGEISGIIETPMGFHLVTVLERKPGEIRPFERVKDKVRQNFLAEKMSGYLLELEQKYQVVWHLPTGS